MMKAEDAVEMANAFEPAIQRDVEDLAVRCLEEHRRFPQAKRCYPLRRGHPRGRLQGAGNMFRAARGQLHQATRPQGVLVRIRCEPDHGIS